MAEAHKIVGPIMIADARNLAEGGELAASGTHVAILALSQCTACAALLPFTIEDRAHLHMQRWLEHAL